MYTLTLKNGNAISLTSAEHEDFIGIFQSISEIAQTADTMTAENLSAVTLTDDNGKQQEITAITLQGFQAVANGDGTYTGHFYYRGVYEEDKLAKAGKILLGGATADKAPILRTTIETLAETMNDEDVVDTPAQFLFPSFDGNGHFYNGGERIIYNGTLYKVLQAHTSQVDWTPETAPSLFAKVLAGQEGTDIGEWTQPDSTNPYMTGDKVIYNGKVYESVIDNNVWSPDTYPAGWKEVTD